MSASRSFTSPLVALLIGTVWGCASTSDDGGAGASGAPASDAGVDTSDAPDGHADSAVDVAIEGAVDGPDGGVCDPVNLYLCDESDCASVGGGWWSGTDCLSEEPGPSATGYGVTYSREGHTISFEFNCDGSPCQYGKFANDWDYWVAPITPSGSVTITKMTPNRTGSDSSLRNGAMMDPTSMGKQAFHGGAVADNILIGGSMADLVDVPVTITPSTKGRPSVIIKSKAAPDSSCQSPDRQCMDYYETLTILQEPPGTVFRPPFFGTEKPLIPYSSFDYSMLSNVPETADTVSWEKAEATVRSVNVAPMLPDRQTGQGMHALVNNQTRRGYDGYVIQELNAALIKLAQDPGVAHAELKRKLALGVAQMGIDLYHIHKNGANPPGNNYPGYGDFSTVPCGAWPAAGGFNQGRLVPIIFSAVMLQRQNWLDTINTNLQSRDGLQCFGETGFVQRNEDNRGKGVPTFGHLNTALYGNIGDCNGTNRNCASVGGSSSANYNLYDGKADGDPLSATGSPTAYQGIVVPLWLGGALPVWLNPTVMDKFPANALHWLNYVKRAKTQGDTVSDSVFGTYNNVSNNSFSTFVNSTYQVSGAVPMWIAYRNCFESRTCEGM